MSQRGKINQFEKANSRIWKATGKREEDGNCQQFDQREREQNKIKIEFFIFNHKLLARVF